jgi:hypothetical protein
MHYHREGDYVSGCMVQIQKDGVWLVWDVGAGDEHARFSQEGLAELDDLNLRMGRFENVPDTLDDEGRIANDWDDPAAWEFFNDSPLDPAAGEDGVPCVVEWIKERELDPEVIYLCFHVDVPAGFVPCCYPDDPDGAFARLKRARADNMMHDPDFHESLRNSEVRGWAARMRLAENICQVPRRLRRGYVEEEEEGWRLEEDQEQ